jgi:serine/threonine protein kinase
MQPTQGRRYRILEVLGSGGFGTVYRAEMLTHSGLRREVALKVLNEQTAGDEEAARRLRDEARILGTLNHFGIVRVDDLLQLDGRWTMVMELVRGWDCEKLLGEYGVFPTSVSLDIVAGVARTLHAVSKAHGPEG